MTETSDFYGSGQMALPATDDQPQAAPQEAVNPYRSGQMNGTPPPPPPQNESFLSRSWRSLRENVESNYATAGQPAIAGEVQSPFFAGVAHGARNAIDYAAEKVARGGEAVLGDTVKTLPGYRSAEDIRGDITQRTKDYESKPENDAGSTGAMLGRGTGAGLVLGGPLARIGGAAAMLLGKAGATALPGVARALEYLSGGATAAPGSSLPVTLATRAGSLSAQGGALGGSTTAVESDPSKPFLPQVAEGAASGAIAGPVAGAVTSAATYPFRAALGLLPSMVSSDVAPLAERFMTDRSLGGYGIKLDPTQLTQNPTYRIMADQAGKLPLSGAGTRVAEARTQWQGALANEMGETADNGVTHAVMDRAAQRIGPGIGAIADRTVIQGGAPLRSDLTDIALDIPRFGLTPEQLPPVKAQLKNVLDAFQQGNGQITGKVYQNLTQTGGPLDNVINSNDPTVHAFGMRIKGALDNAFQRSAAPDDQAALKALQYQYRVMKTVQPLVEQKGLTGDIEPNALLARVRAQSAKFDPSTGGLAYTGGGRLGDLAYGGQMFFGKQPDSGTTARWLTAGLVGGGISTAVAHPLVPAGTLAGLLANRGVQSVIRSPAVGSSMVENTLRPPGPWTQRLTPYVVPGLLDQQP